MGLNSPFLIFLLNFPSLKIFVTEKLIQQAFAFLTVLWTHPLQFIFVIYLIKVILLFCVYAFQGVISPALRWLLLTVFRFTKGPLLASLALPICFDAYCQFISLLSSNTDHFKLLNLSFQNIGSLKSKHAAIEFL